MSGDAPGTEGLAGRQRRQLRAMAHHLKPVVQVGKEGVTSAVAEALDQALDDHELVKARVLEGAPTGRKEAAAELAHRVGAHVAGVVGRVAILYRRHPTDPRIELEG